MLLETIGEIEMQSHVKVVAWLYIVMGVLGILFGGIAGLFVAGGGWISGDQTAMAVTTIVALVTVGLLVLLSAPGIIAGLGLLSYKPWARILALILAVLNLPGFPVGTIVGIYTLWALLDDESAPVRSRSLRKKRQCKIGPLCRANLH
jgi:hypothetical protein